MRPPEQKVTLQVLRLSDDEIRVTPFKEGSALESTIKTSRVCPFHAGLVADRAREILGLLARANVGVTGLLDELVEAGRAIYVDLLPAFLKEKLDEARGKALLLNLDRTLVGIPWELLHDGDDFLGRHFRIGRLVSVDSDSHVLRRRMTPPLSALVVADPSGDLPAAREEAEEVEQLLEDASVVGPVTTLTGRVTLRTFRDELGKHDLLHYAGHADFDARTGEATLRLADGSLSSRMVQQLHGRVDLPGIVFLNACGSAEDSHALSAGGDPLGGAGGVAAALLMSGVRHVVGTLWEVRDEVARTFATAFYRMLCGSESIGAAMSGGQQAVLTRFGEDSLLWADHLLYGDPTFAIAPPRNLAFDDFDVLDGLERRYREELFSEDGATRLLAVAMLLRLGDESVVSALDRDLPLLEHWMSLDATLRERRQAAHVVQALATAAGLSPSDPPDELPDFDAVKLLVKRLVDRGSG